MKTKLPGLFALMFLLGLAPASAQLFDNLRALGGTRYAVGEPALFVTNLHGLRVDGPKDVAVSDLDGDGFPDFAAANKDGTVTVRFNTGTEISAARCTCTPSPTGRGICGRLRSRIFTRTSGAFSRPPTSSPRTLFRPIRR